MEKRLLWSAAVCGRTIRPTKMRTVLSRFTEISTVSGVSTTRVVFRCVNAFQWSQWYQGLPETQIVLSRHGDYNLALRSDDGSALHKHGVLDGRTSVGLQH